MNHLCSKFCHIFNKFNINSVDLIGYAHITLACRLALAGQEPEVSALYPEVAFPVPRGTASLAQLATWQHDDTTYNDTLDELDWGSEQEVRILYYHRQQQSL